LLAQHPDFSRVLDIPDGPVYSILDINTALEKLASVCPPRQAEDDICPPDRLTRLDLLRYCVLAAAQQMLPGITQPPHRGFLKLSETILGTDIPPELYFKSMVLLCELQSAVDSLLRLDTFGEAVLEELDLKATLNLRAITSRLLSQVSLSQVSPRLPVSSPSSRPSAGELAKRKIKRAAIFRRQIALSKSSELGAEGAHLALIELDDAMAKRESPLTNRVRSYFEENDLETLLCPISERPMTDAVYLRCGKTVSKAALLELIAGNIPANHCCCEDIHDDIQHILHDSPLTSDLAVRHLSRVLHIDEVVQYGDLKTMQKMYSGVQDETERAELLHLAITGKNSSAVEFLLEDGIDPNVPRNGKLPLVRAASLGLDDVVTALLDHGADAAARDTKGKSALAHAAHNGHQSVVELLFFSMSNIPFDAAISAEMDLPPDDRRKSAEALHDLWQALKEARAQDAILYLQRAMELDPENHVYAEEMQVYLDDEDDRNGTPRVHTNFVGEILLNTA
jgi:Ankyrin repeats (3 copies)